MQILVVVANIQMRTLKAEVEKGSARTAFVRRLVDPKAHPNGVVNVLCMWRGVLACLVLLCFLALDAERESGENS